MKTFGFLWLVFLQFCMAAIAEPTPKFAVDASCERSPLSSGIKKNIIGSIKEAIDYAKIAASEFVTEDEAKTLKIPAGTCLKNEDCKAMLKYILGDDYNEKINDVKKNLTALGQYELSNLPPLGDKWRDQATNKNVAFFCDLGRFATIPRQEDYVLNKAWGKKSDYPRYKFDLELLRNSCNIPNDRAEVGRGGLRLIKGKTDISAYYDENGAKAMKQTNPEISLNDRLFYSPVLTDSNSIQLCQWFIQKQNKHTLSRNRYTFDELFDNMLKGKYPDGKTKAIDVFDNMSKTVLHEFMHTDLGGSLVDDVSLREGDNKKCYGWDCIGRLGKLPTGAGARNADSIAFLAMCMRIYKKGYHVLPDGSIQQLGHK